MIFNKTIDLFFIKFPIIFFIIYLSFLFIFPSQEQKLSFIVLLLFAEPHFGATWTMFMDKKMLLHAKNKKYSFIFGTLFLIIISISLFLIDKISFIFLFFSYNIWHVTKQSIGICRYYTKKKSEIKFQENFLWLLNILIIFLGAFLNLSLRIFTEKNILFNWIYIFI